MSSNLVGGLHRKIGRLLAPEEYDRHNRPRAGRVASRARRRSGHHWQQRSGQVDRGQAVPERKRRDQFAMSDRQAPDRTIRPLFDSARTPRWRARSPLPRALPAAHSTPNDGATDWIAPQLTDPGD